MKSSRKMWTSLVLAFALCLIGAVNVAANAPNEPDDKPVAEIDIRDGVIAWHPLIDSAMALSVSGPSGQLYREFKRNETPFIKIYEEELGELMDGSYSWELTAMPPREETSPGTLPSGRKWEPDPREVPPEQRQSGYITVCEGSFADPYKQEDNAQAHSVADPAKDFVINDDLIVDGSACIGFDCVNGESFSFDTIRLKENNLRIKFDDTSVAASFPRNDWQLTANDSANGGASKFSIDDVSGSRTPFTVEANARSHSLYVDDGGRIGIRTSTPSTEIHVIDGDTPTLRLQQDGSSGFEPQTWDVAGNETNFFIRDVTNGSALPFRIRPGAPTSSIFIDVDGDVGIGTASPSNSLHVRRSDATSKVLIEEATTTAGTYTLLELETTGGTGINLRPRFTMTHGGNSAAWNFDVLNDGNFAFIRNGGSVFTFEAGGDLRIDGDFIANGTTLNVPDYVFADDYSLMPLDEVKAFIDRESHLPEVPSAEEVQTGGLKITEMQLKLLQKVEELTLYTLDQHETIQSHQDTIRTQQEMIQELMSRLDNLEANQR